MKKVLVLSVIASAALGLSACGGAVSNNSSDVVLNADDGNMGGAIDDANVSDNAVVDANASNAAE
jgi:protein involved in sex pheromone biosynthesis